MEFERKMTEILQSGHTVVQLTEEENEALKRFHAYRDGAIRLKPENWIFPSAFPKFANQIYNFRVRPSDIYVVALPKSGTNWMQEIVWNLVNNPDLDNPEADETIDSRCTSFGIDFFFAISDTPPLDPDGEVMKKFKKLCPDTDPSEGIFINLSAFTPDPRLIKNHLPCSLLPPDILKKSKIVYLARDPKDVMVSLYHFSKLHKMAPYYGTLEDFVEDYILDRTVYTPYWEHMRQAWGRRNCPNLLFVFYENLKADPKSEIKRIDQFLGTNRTDKQIDNIVEYTSFANMKERTKNSPPTSLDNKFLNEEEGASFFRKGKAGSWKEDFSPELEEKVNAWMKKNLAAFEDDFKYKF